MCSDVHDNTSLKSVGYIDLFLKHINFSVFHSYQTVTKSFYILSAQVCIESYKHCAFKSKEIAKTSNKHTGMKNETLM